MALIFIGFSKSAICGKVLLENDEVSALGPSARKDHELYKYFDCGFHSTCFEAWDRKKDAINILREEDEEFRNSDYYKEMVREHGLPNRPEV